jgi:diguanylate cyclase (GGDEF)-like protein
VLPPVDTLAVVDLIVLGLAVLATFVTLGLLVLYLREEARGRRRGPASAERFDRRSRTVAARDPREAIAHVGNALAATHDPRALLPVILEVTVEATGASGGRVLEGERELAWVGQPTSEKPLELDLGSSTDGDELLLLVYPPEGGLPPDAVELAGWLVSQASIALENARLHHVVRRQAITDELTGLVNRRRFMEALDAEIARAQRLNSSVSLLLADIDDFKRINDLYGHPAGDEALRAFADGLREHLREIDIAARLGGEEFAVLLPETSLEGALAVAERLRTTIDRRAVLHENDAPVHLTASIGVAEYRHGSRDDLLRSADAGLYQAKQQGKNRVAAAPGRE